MHRFILIAATLFLTAGMCSDEPNEPIVIPIDKPDTPDEPEKPEDNPGTTIEAPAFATGADISWVSEMENDGKKFKLADGTNADIYIVLKETGVNAIRLRVWVNPYNGWSGKDDMVALAKRATEAGLPVMVDFHYSDFFTDPSRQGIPEAWKGDSGDIDKMAKHVGDFTTEVLNALKAKDVSPVWVQIGNETRNGMLWPTGQLWNSSGNISGGYANFTKLYMAGYNAVKAIFPKALVMPHLNNAYDDNAWWFTAMQNEGLKFDMIALSHYPQVIKDKTWEWGNETAATRVKALGSKYGVKVMVSEIGVKASDPTTGKTIIQDFLTRVKALDCCAGVFYWEPEVYGGWRPAVYKDANAIKQYTGKSETWNSYDMGAFTASGKASAIREPFKD